METLELINYLKDVGDYIEYSFYSNSSEIMNAIAKNGFEKVFNVVSINEIKKGVYHCLTTWDDCTGTIHKKEVIIDISGEMVFITEALHDTNTSKKNNESSIDIDVQKEYEDILKLLKKRHLNTIEKDILYKVVKAFFED